MNTICCKMYRSTISQAVMRNQPAGKKKLRTMLNPLTLNDPYSGRTAPPNSKNRNKTFYEAILDVLYDLRTVRSTVDWA